MASWASCTREDMPSLAYTWVRWVSTVRGEMKSRVAMSLFGSPSVSSRTTSSSVGVSEFHPEAGRLRSPRPALHIGDRLVGRERGAFGPCGLEVADAHRGACVVDRGLIVGVEVWQPHLAGALPHRPGRAEESRCLGV